MTDSRKTVPSGSITQIAWRTLKGLLLVGWAWMLVDLVTHPLASGSNPSGPLFRWLSALIGSVTILTALLIIRKVPGSPLGLLLFLYGIGTTGWSIRTEWADMRFGIAANLIFGMTYFQVSIPALILLLFYFPNGKPHPPRLKRWMPAITALMVVAGSFYMLSTPSVGGPPVKIPNSLFTPALERVGFVIFLAGIITGMGSGLVTLVLRYRAGNERLRLQLKWMVWLLAIGTLLAAIPFDSLAGSFDLIGFILQTAFFVFLGAFPALGIGIAILRHHLWGIDILIRRTLVYSILTTLLGGVYYGSVVGLQTILTADGGPQSAVGGQPSAVVIVATTLAIAALFTPLRRSVQNFIDRRFYRRKYDAEKALAQFAAAARSETDLESLTKSMLEIIQATMQPERVLIWMKPDAKRQAKDQEIRSL